MIIAANQAQFNQIIKDSFMSQYSVNAENFVDIKKYTGTNFLLSISNSSGVQLEIEFFFPFEDSLSATFVTSYQAFNHTLMNFRDTSTSFVQKIKRSLPQVSGITVSQTASILRDVVQLHSPIPSSMPTSMPSCGYGSYGPKGDCGKCPPGYYEIRFGAKSCIACPIGFYAPDFGSSSCEKCRYPYTTLNIASSACDSAVLKVNKKFLISVMGTCAILFLFSMNYAGDKKIFMFIMALTPALNFFATLMYILTSKFYSQPLFHVTIISFLLPNLYFTCILYQMKAYPFLSRIYPGYYLISPRVLWMTFQDGYPSIITKLTEDGKSVAESKPFRMFDDHESLFKLFLYSVSVIVYFALQLFTAGLFLLFLGLISPVVIFWFFCGCFFYQSKLISMKGIWNMWFRVWAGTEDHSISADVDSSIMNESLAVEFLYLTIPQLLTQIVNNSILVNNWTVFSWICFGILASSFINGLSRFGYFLFMSDIDIVDVPLEVNLFNKNYTLDQNKSVYSRNKSKRDEMSNEEKASNSKLRKIYKDQIKSYKTKQSNLAKEKDEDKQRCHVAWNILVNHAGDTKMLEFLRAKGLTAMKLKDAPTEVLSDITRNIKDPDIKDVVTEVFKTFPNFDDGSFTASAFTIAEQTAVAEESITVEAL